jgi:hypothetical protein
LRWHTTSSDTNKCVESRIIPNKERKD